MDDQGILCQYEFVELTVTRLISMTLKITSVSCGKEHVIALSQLGMVLTMGQGR